MSEGGEGQEGKELEIALSRLGGQEEYIQGWAAGIFQPQGYAPNAYRCSMDQVNPFLI